MPSQQAITECHHKKPSQQRPHSSALKRQGGHSRNARVDELLDFALHKRNGVHHALRPDDVHLARREEARWAQVERVLVPVVAEDGVSRILTRVDPSDHL